MIVDCHTHITCPQAPAFDLSEHLEAAETVDKCIVLPTPDFPFEQANRQVSEYAAKYPDKVIGFCLVDPTTDPVTPKNLKSATEKLGLKGLVLYCSRCGFHPAHTRAMRLYESAADLELPVFFHNAPLGPQGALEYAQPFLLDEVARTFPELRIIIGAMGLPFFEQSLCLIAKQKNVYADLTIRPTSPWQIYNVVVAAHETGVMEKLLFGSGFPFAKAGQCIETLLGFNKLLGEANLPIVPRGSIRAVIERDTLQLLQIK